ncbi:MAG: malto-oligosyltrehalose synthase, partial [Rariglobus sp.]
MPYDDAARYPRATYRVQLHAGFTLDDLTARIPYLHALGISDVYCPPLFQASAGSKHGYDVCDYRRVSRDLGGEEALARLSAALRERGMGLLLDFVPNHMGIEGTLNTWWRDVLEQGQQSSYAAFFDIRWQTRVVGQPTQIMLPLLPDHYGCLLQEGKLGLVSDEGALEIACGEMRFPVRAGTYAEILQATGMEVLHAQGASFLEFEEACKKSPQSETAADRLAHQKAQLGQLLADNVEAKAQLEAVIARLNGTPGDPTSFDALDRLIEGQHYRLARWQAGAHGINYRRFFAINTLVGLRMEDEAVFAETHATLARLLRDGVVTGVRIDHIDGLRDPQAYLERLRRLTQENRPAGSPMAYVIVEKILGQGERLPATWSAHGTTGYDFIPQLAGLFTARENEQALDEIHRDFTTCDNGFLREVTDCKRTVIRELFPSTVLTLAQALHDLIQIDRRWRDLTVSELSAGIQELIIGLAVYRTYRRSDESLRPEDQTAITRAWVAATRNNPRIEPKLVKFVSTVWSGEYPEGGADKTYREKITEWVLSLQQYTGAVMAKSVEDTAYYTYNRLIALNEVGGFPEQFGAPIEAFHEVTLTRRDHCPASMLTTSTHDTKVSEDVRARLYALSEIPEEWSGWISEWSSLNATHKTLIGGRLAPDASEEYRLYQTLLGAWPLNADRPDETFRKRIGDYFEKAINEAKVNTTAAHPSPDWIAACRRFSDAILSEDDGNRFLERFRPA